MAKIAEGPSGHHIPGGYHVSGGYHVPGGYHIPGGYCVPGGYHVPGGAAVTHPAKVMLERCLAGPQRLGLQLRAAMGQETK